MQEDLLRKMQELNQRPLSQLAKKVVDQPHEHSLYLAQLIMQALDLAMAEEIYPELDEQQINTVDECVRSWPSNPELYLWLTETECEDYTEQDWIDLLTQMEQLSQADDWENQLPLMEQVLKIAHYNLDANWEKR